MTSPERFWFADYDDRQTGACRWQPVLQGDGICTSCEIWFETEQACEEFIRDEILGARARFDAIPDNIIWVTVSRAGERD